MFGLPAGIRGFHSLTRTRIDPLPGKQTPPPLLRLCNNKTRHFHSAAQPLATIQATRNRESVSLTKNFPTVF